MAPTSREGSGRLGDPNLVHYLVVRDHRCWSEYEHDAAADAPSDSGCLAGQTQEYICFGTLLDEFLLPFDVFLSIKLFSIVHSRTNSLSIRADQSS